MTDYVNQLYEALDEVDIDTFTDIYFDIRDSKIDQKEEDILSLCDLFNHEFEYMEPDIVLKITKMIFFAVNKFELENSFRKLVKGLSEIYKNSLGDEDSEVEYDDYFYEILCMLVGNYDEKAMILFGELVSICDCSGLKTKILEVLEETLQFNDREGFLRNKDVLVNRIK